MAYRSNSELKIPSTAEVPAAVNIAAHIGTEICTTEDESGIDSPRHGNQPHVTPEMEKRLLRKLDRRLIPHIMFLCTSPIIIETKNPG